MTPPLLLTDPLDLAWEPDGDGHLDPLIPSVHTGVLLGNDAEQLPVVVRLFREQPTEVALIGGAWAARLLIVRALAVGAWVLVRTIGSVDWDGLGQSAAGVAERVQVLHDPSQMPAGTGSPHRPLLFVDDLGAGSPERSPLGPWQTRLTVLRRLTAYGFQALAEANLVVLQRLTAEEATGAAAVLGMAPQTVELVQVMYDDMLALIGGGVNRYLWTAPTEADLSVLGAPRRD